jgi:hypothetical protein
MSGRGEVEELDVFIHLGVGSEMRIKGRLDSQSRCKSW